MISLDLVAHLLGDHNAQVPVQVEGSALTKDHRLHCLRIIDALVNHFFIDLLHHSDQVLLDELLVSLEAKDPIEENDGGVEDHFRVD